MNTVRKKTVRIKRSDSGAVQASTVVLVALGVILIGAGLYVYMSSARDTVQAGADLATDAPAAANTVAVAADAQNIRLAVETAVIDSGGHVPTVSFDGSAYVVKGSTTDVQSVPASAGVTAAGITGSTGEDYCVWVSAANGITMHTDHNGEPQVGGC